jgi:hypothetical protein
VFQDILIQERVAGIGLHPREATGDRRKEGAPDSERTNQRMKDEG